VYRAPAAGAAAGNAASAQVLSQAVRLGADSSDVCRRLKTSELTRATRTHGRKTHGKSRCTRVPAAPRVGLAYAAGAQYTCPPVAQRRRSYVDARSIVRFRPRALRPGTRSPLEFYRWPCESLGRRVPPAQSASEKRHAGHFSEPGGELVLKNWVFHFLGRRLRSAVMPVSAADSCRGIFAHGKPCLREIALFEIVRRTRPAHLRRNPPGIDGIAQHVGPASCDGERKCSQIELAV
jgi:hypothetical protein